MTAIGIPLTELTGLSSIEAERRLRESGSNEIRRESPVTPLALLLHQFDSPVIWLLLAASGMSVLVGEFVDASAIAVIVIVNAAIGFFQEHRAERAVLALRSMTAPRARVIRDGRSSIVKASEVVPGDLLALEAGDIVAADASLVSAHALLTQEAALTGESLPVEKTTEPAPAEAP